MTINIKKITIKKIDNNNNNTHFITKLERIGLVHASHFYCVEFNSIKCGRNTTVDPNALESVSHFCRVELNSTT